MSDPRPPTPKDPDLQRRVEALLSSRDVPINAAGEHRRPFTAYDDRDIERATELASSMMSAAAEGGTEGLAAALGVAERSLEVERPGLVPHALKLFITHHDEARRHLRIPPLEHRQSDPRGPPPDHDVG